MYLQNVYTISVSNCKMTSLCVFSFISKQALLSSVWRENLTQVFKFLFICRNNSMGLVFLNDNLILLFFCLVLKVMQMLLLEWTVYGVTVEPMTT